MLGNLGLYCNTIHEGKKNTFISMPVVKNYHTDFCLQGLGYQTKYGMAEKENSFNCLKIAANPSVFLEEEKIMLLPKYLGHWTESKKNYSVFSLFAIHSHVRSFALRFLFLQNHATSCSFYSSYCTL
jgi:hypothetical protein